jgi:Zn-dependent membrane protease YugP
MGAKPGATAAQADPTMIFDPLYLLLTLPALVFSIWAQVRVKSTFHRYERVGLRSGMSGAEAARAIVRASGMEGVTVERHAGFLSDHYDPRAKSLRLSPAVYDGRSVSAVAVAAHEAGHSLQDAHGYAPLVLRSKLVPLTQIGSMLWYWPFILGLWMNLAGLIWLGIIAFGAVVLFQIVTLPTEFDASNRAKGLLAETGIVTTQEEALGVEKVLGAAALTYVAALVAAVLQLLYMLLRARDR